MLAHYWQLLKHHKRVGIAAVAGAALLAVVVSIALLATKPTYLARTTVLLLPSDAEIAFARGLVSSEHAALTLTETHVEYLQSRSVAAAVLERLRASREELAGGGADDEEGAQGGRSPVAVVLGWFSKALNYLNYGMHVPSDPEEGLISMIASSIKVISIKGSYILQFQVRLGSPELAAEVANALADVYIEQVTTDLELNAERLQDYIGREIAAKERELEQIVTQEVVLRKELGLTTAVDERSDLSTALEFERKQMAEEQVQIGALEARLEELRKQLGRAVRPELLARIEQELSIGDSELRALRTSVAQRRENVRQMETMVDNLADGEQLLAGVLARKQLAQQDLQNLRQRLLSTELTRTAAIAKVRVIDPASPPKYPESPKVLNNTVLGGIAGAVIFALFLVAVDTFSTRVVTAAELSEATGARTLGRLGGEILAATRGDGKRRELARLASLGERFERRLAVVGEGSVLEVTGFVDPSELGDATTALAACLAATGRPVRCELPGGATPSSGTLDALAGELRFAPAGEPAGGDTLLLRAVEPATRGLRLEEVRSRDANLVCTVPADRLTPEELRDFQQRVAAAGLTAVSYLLLDA